MDDFLQEMQNETALSKLDTEHAFAARAVCQLLQLFKIDPPIHLKKDPEFGFGWFRDNYSGFPVYLEARRMVLDGIDIWEHLPKSAAFNELMTLVEETRLVRCGIILRVAFGRYTAKGLWIIHTHWNSEHAAGQLRLVYRAKSTDRGIIVESLPSFVRAISSEWTPS